MKEAAEQGNSCEKKVVDPAGVEPASKQGMTEVSTCLFFYWFSRSTRQKTALTLPYRIFFSLGLFVSTLAISL